jgi:hypothetical protein
LAARVAWPADGPNRFAWLTAAHVLTLGRMTPNGPSAALNNPSATEPLELGSVVPRSCWRKSDGVRLDAGLVREVAPPASLGNSVAALVAGYCDTLDIGPDSAVMLIDQDDTVQDLAFHAWSEPGDVVLKLAE